MSERGCGHCVIAGYVAGGVCSAKRRRTLDYSNKTKDGNGNGNKGRKG